MEQRISLITLGVSNLGRSSAFYRDLGWSGTEVDETVFFQAGGIAVVLWDRQKLAEDSGITDDGGVFGGIVLAHNVRTPDEVDRLMATAEAAGAHISTPARVTFYGGYAGVFRDPDGHAWEIAFNPGFALNENGALILPFGSER